MRKDVKNFIYPTFWYSELPFLTAVQVQQNWAYTHNVNLLAAGANRPAMANTGSGIYSGVAGAITSYISEMNRTVILTAEIPKVPGTQQPASRDLPRDQSAYGLNLWEQDLGQFKTNVLDFAKNTTQIGQVCHQDLCCKYEVQVTDSGESKDMVIFRIYIPLNVIGDRVFLIFIHISVGTLMLLSLSKDTEHLPVLEIIM